MKKLVSLFLSIAMIVTTFVAFGITASAANEVALKINGTEYTGETLENCITSSNVSTNQITSLEIVSGTIDSAAWNYLLRQSGGGTKPNMSQSLQTLVISNSVILESLFSTGKNEIGMGAFQYDEKLEKVNTGSAQGITDMAFIGCTALTEVTAPNATKIVTDAFEDCTSLVKLNLPATPPTAGIITGTPANKSLGFVSADGTPLKEKNLINAISAYKAVNDGDTTDDYWYGWKLPKSPHIIDPNTSGNSPLAMNGTAIPAPTYTVTIPQTIAFGECQKAMANDTEANRIKEMTVNGLKITHSNLFVNEKQVTVSLSSDFTIKNANNTLSFELYDGDTKILTNATLITANPIAADDNVSSTKTITAKLDKSKIKKADTYNGVVRFTVALTDIA